MTTEAESAGRGRNGATNFEILVCGLLPFLVHGVRCWLGEHASGGKDSQTGKNADKDTESNRLALSRGSLSTGAMRTEGNPVRYEVIRLATPGTQCHDARRRMRAGPIALDKHCRQTQLRILC